MSRLYQNIRTQENRTADVFVEEGMKLVSLLPPDTGDSPDSGDATEVDTPTFITNGGGLLADYGSHTVAKLRQELKNRGLSHKGIKVDLVWLFCSSTCNVIHNLPLPHYIVYAHISRH